MSFAKGAIESFSPWARRRYGFMTIESLGRRIFFRASEAVRVASIGPKGELIHESGLFKEPGSGDSVFVEINDSGELVRWGFLADLRRAQQACAAGLLSQGLFRSVDRALALKIIYTAGMGNSRLQYRLERKSFNCRAFRATVEASTRLVGKFGANGQPAFWRALSAPLTLSGGHIASPKHLVELAVVQPNPTHPLITIFSL